ncbi:choice-of-anchor E domain-containing protein [Singulisphaera sp. Ch08]|uniref:Choice-of-anchor E domain-containing protein n=1 Tax=Singulisphaera sp. Ch08 TaxID=3120278 RepID=A0AAU7CGP7_9BACT
MRVRASGFGFICLAVSLLGGLSVQAAVTPVQTQSIAPAYAIWGPNTTFQGQDPLVFSKFDPGLGTLQSVNISVSYSFSHKVSMTFGDSSDRQTISLTSALPQTPTVGPTITLNGPANGPLSTLLTATAPVVTYTRSYGSPGENLPQSFSNNPNQFSPGSPFFLTPDGMPDNLTSTFTGTQTLAITDPSQVALFQGSGTLGLPASANFGATVTGTGNNYAGYLVTYAGITVSLSYTYAVPEPPSAALLGLGTGGLVLLGRLRRRRPSR